MPELLVPVCSLGYHDQHRQPESPIEDTLVVLTDAEREWYRQLRRWADGDRTLARSAA